MTEGGRNQGYDPLVVEQLVESNVERTRRILGGPVALANAWASAGLTPEAFRIQRERGMLGRTWEDSMTGRGPGAHRPSHGRTATCGPGLIQEEYRSRLTSPSAELRSSVGIEPERLALQQVILGLQAYSREDATRIAARIDEEIGSSALTMEQAVNTFTLPEATGGNGRSRP